MMIRFVVNCMVNLGLLLWCLDINMMCWWVLTDRGKQISLWRTCLSFCGAGLESGGLVRPLC